MPHATESKTLTVLAMLDAEIFSADGLHFVDRDRLRKLVGEVRRLVIAEPELPASSTPANIREREAYRALGWDDGANRVPDGERERWRTALRYAAQAVDGINDVDLHEAALALYVERTEDEACDLGSPGEDDYMEAFVNAVCGPRPEILRANPAPVTTNNNDRRWHPCARSRIPRSRRAG